jgi:hypothetical protein
VGRKPKPDGDPASVSLNKRRWRNDPQGLDRHVRMVVERAPALSDEQINTIRAAIAAAESPPDQRETA